MRHLSIASSSLPSLIIPCPRCAMRMAFRSTSSTQAEPNFQDTVYACEQCGTEIVRTTYRAIDAVDPARAA